MAMGLDAPAIVGIVIGLFFLFIIMLACCFAVFGAKRLSRKVSRTHHPPPVRIDSDSSRGSSRESHFQHRTVIVGAYQGQPQIYPTSPLPGAYPAATSSHPGTYPSHQPATSYPVQPGSGSYTHPYHSQPPAAGGYPPQPPVPGYPSAQYPPYNPDFAQPTLPGQPIETAGYPPTTHHGHYKKHKKHKKHKRHGSSGSGSSGGSGGS